MAQTMLSRPLPSLVMLIFCMHGFMAEAAEENPDDSLRQFEHMLAQVYQQNPKLQAERDALKIADEHVAQANAGYRPTLNANAEDGRQREKVAGQNWVYGRDTSESLVAIQPLFSGFGTLEQKRAAEARVKAARAHLLATEQSVLFSAISDWMELCEKEKVLALNEDNLHRMYQYSQAADERFKAGDSTQTDVAQAESRVAQAEAKQALAEAARDSARANFERDTQMPAPAVDLPPLPDGLPTDRKNAEEMAGKNPDLAQAEAEEIAAKHDISAAESTLWPSVYLRGSMSQERSPSLGLERLRDDSLTINVSIPLYQGGGEYSKIREAKLTREKSRENSMDTAEAVLERARLSWDNFYAAQRVIVASQKATHAAGKALWGVQEEQKQGLRTLTEVLDEQSEFVETQITETQAQKTLKLEAYRLLAATGRLTAEELHLTDKPFDPKAYHDDAVPRWAGTSIDR